MKLELLLTIAGILQLGLLTAGATMSRMTDMRTHLAKLPPFLRQLFWVYFGFIGFVLLGFGVLTLVQTETLAAGSGLARWLCGFMAFFWLGRLAVQFFVFDLKPYLTGPLLRLGYHATTVVFVYLVAVYAWAAGKGVAG